MKKEIEKYGPGQSVALPLGTTKSIQKVKADTADSVVLGIDIAIGTVASGITATAAFHLATGLATFATLNNSMADVGFPIASTALVAGFIGGLLSEKYSTAKKYLGVIKSGYSFEGRIPVTNAFPGLKEKRLPITLTSSTGEQDEVVLVSNRKGVWIEKLNRKPSLAIWDEAMASICEVYSLTKSSIKKG